jgi:hypothetical protein
MMDDLDIVFKPPYPHKPHNMPFNRNNNIDWEICQCLELVYEILDSLEDLRLGLEREKEITEILHPRFDSFKTIGKYC